MLTYRNTSQNYKQGYLFGNGVFRDPSDGRVISKALFGTNFYNINKNTIRSMKYSDCFIDNSFKSLNRFRQHGLNFTVNVWLKLGTICLDAKRRLSERRDVSNETISIEQFFRQWKKRG
jgi:hypothetical protein